MSKLDKKYKWNIVDINRSDDFILKYTLYNVAELNISLLNGFFAYFGSEKKLGALVIAVSIILTISFKLNKYFDLF
jgi:hypothetical protein